MSIPKRGAKIMDNNIRIKSGMVQPHSKPLKASGQEIDPYPTIIKKKVKKKEKEGLYQFTNPGITIK